MHPNLKKVAGGGEGAPREPCLLSYLHAQPWSHNNGVQLPTNRRPARNQHNNGTRATCNNNGRTHIHNL